MLCKIFGRGMKGYTSDSMNIFDCIIVLISLLELTLMNGSPQTGLSALRAFRLLRIFRLVRSWKSLHKLLRIAGNVFMSQALSFMVLLFVFMYIFALVGMQIFGGKLVDDEGISVRHNFDSISWAMMTVFQVLTGENWNSVMYDAMIYYKAVWPFLYFFV